MLDALRQYLADLAGPSQYYRDETGQLRPKPSALADGVQYASPADVETLQEPAFSPVDLIDPDILKAMYIPASKKVLNALADGDMTTRVFSALHDRMPRVEIDDSAARFVGYQGEVSPEISAAFRSAGLEPPAKFGGDSGDGQFSDLISHPELNDELGGYPTRWQYYPDRAVTGGHMTSQGITVSYATPEDAIRTGLHEGQHLFQERGGFARGGSPEAMELAYNNSRARLNFLQNEPDFIEANKIHDDLWNSVFNDDMPMEEAIAIEQQLYQKYPSFGESKRVIDELRQYSNKSNYDAQDTFNIGRDAYRRLAGEIEARDTAARMNMNALDRARTQPYTGYQVRADGTFGPAYDIGGDIPLEDYIVRRDGGNALSVGDKVVTETISPSELEKKIAEGYEVVRENVIGGKVRTVVVQKKGDPLEWFNEDQRIKDEAFRNMNYMERKRKLERDKLKNRGYDF